MTDIILAVIAAAAIGYAAWYERRIGRRERGDREFVRRHQVRRASADRHDDRRINQVRRDPSPKPRERAS